MKHPEITIDGYSKDHIDEEFHLHDVLRKTSNTHLYGMICTTLSNAGGLFCVPILVAHPRKMIQKQRWQSRLWMCLKSGSVLAK